MSKSRYHFIFSLLLFISSVLCHINATIAYQDDSRVQTENIPSLMKEVFEQHVVHKKMNVEIFRRSIANYLNQFDPFRIYLLESDVSSFLNLSDQELEKRIKDFEIGNLNLFKHINDRIQRAIKRSRLVHKELFQKSNEWFRNKAEELKKTREDLRDIPYPKSMDAIRSNFEQFVFSYFTKQRNSPASWELKSHTILTELDQELSNKENSYLFVNGKGMPLPQRDKDHLFALRILKAMMTALDAHSSFLDNEEAYQMRLRLEKEYHGIGIVLEKHDGKISIGNILKGSSAEKCGALSIGDELVSVNSVQTSGKDLDDIIQLLQGPKDQVVNIEVRKASSIDSGLTTAKPPTIKVQLFRASITIEEGRVDMSSERYEEGIIGKITLHSFYQSENGPTSEIDVRDAIEQLRQQGNLIGLILDLRDNRGGFLNQAVKVTGLFITSGVVVICKYSDGSIHYFRDTDPSMIYNGPLIILTSKGTASAAEIVAQSLKDFGKAIIVGDEQTYGKGTIQMQTVTDEDTGSYFKVTVGTYYTVSGLSTQRTGVKADVVVPGIYYSRRVGEEYLHFALDAGSVDSAYKDQLQDVDYCSRSWYRAHYLPYLQKKIAVWRKWIPELQKRSAKRIANDQNYQAILTDNKMSQNHNRLSQENLYEEKILDLQMAEAINVLKDLIDLTVHKDGKKIILEK